MSEKQCSKCKEWKDLSCFCKDKSNKDGLYSQCKECEKKYREKNKDRKKKYDKDNKDKALKRSKKYINLPMKFNSKAKRRKDIELYEEVRESKDGNLEARCAYCNDWFEPSKRSIDHRLTSINNIGLGECRLYCSEGCKNSCPSYRQTLYFRDQKEATSREVQPELRKLVLERDKYICQKCKKHKDELEKIGLHCHHIEGILWEPLQSADVDMCITLCADCHKEVHQIEGCTYYDMQCTG